MTLFGRTPGMFLIDRLHIVVSYVLAFPFRMLGLLRHYIGIRNICDGVLHHGTYDSDYTITRSDGTIIIIVCIN